MRGNTGIAAAPATSRRTSRRRSFMALPPLFSRRRLIFTAAARTFSTHQVDTPIIEVVDPADNADLLVGHGLVDDRRCRFQLLDIEGHILADRIVELTAALVGNRLDRRLARGAAAPRA